MIANEAVTVVCRCTGVAVAMSGAVLRTRSATNVWLVGQPLHCIENLNQLPTISEVLQRVFYDLKVKKLTLSASCNNAAGEVLRIWYLANIPTRQKLNATEKLKKLHHQPRNTYRNKDRRSKKLIRIAVRSK